MFVGQFSSNQEFFLKSVIFNHAILNTFDNSSSEYSFAASLAASS
jgi:hypothetical protein